MDFLGVVPIDSARYNCYDVNIIYNNLVPRQGLSSLPPLVVGTETLVAAGHVTTQNLGGRKICWKGGATGFFIVTVTKCTRPNVLEYPPTLRFWMDRWSRDQPQPGSLFQRLREAEKRDLGNEVEFTTAQD